MFRMFFQGNPFRQATMGLAKGALFAGLLLIGLGFLVWVLKEVFAIIVMIFFFMAGFSAIGYAIRLFILQYKMKGTESDYRKNVQIHYEDENIP